MNVKLQAGNRLIPVNIEEKGARLFFTFPYNKALMAEIKEMAGAKWHGYDTPPVKQWSVLNNSQNRFQLSYLMGNNPYKPYDIDLANHPCQRNVYKHQQAIVDHALTRHRCIVAAEMGTGKTLAGIEIMEQSGFTDWWWVAPKSALRSVYLELSKWGSKVTPKLITYDGLRSIIKDWKAGDPAPRGVIFDESSRLKNPTAQRTQAATHLAESMRTEYGEDCFIILMSGSPAPKSPADWWSQCQVACPGYLKEGTEIKFRKRLGLIVDKESIAGGIYPHLVTWKDDEKKCAICGELADHECHMMLEHQFTPSVNEVALLYERMKGLVQVTLKKDCLDLPDKMYRIIQCQPSESIVRAASMIANTSTSTIKALTLLRELSDGFQYQDVSGDKSKCPACMGTALVTINEEPAPCPYCNGTGEIVTTVRNTSYVECPKEEALLDLLDEYEEVGRLVIYAGFSGSIDRIIEICKKAKWAFLKVDGRGWHAEDENGMPIDTDTALKALDGSYKDRSKLAEQYPRLAYIGHPGSGGMGLTLTASPAVVYYSNDFNAENRVQSEDRIHRLGMDTNKGAMIIDIFHLPTDEYVLQNLKKKRDLQSLSLGDLQNKIKESL